MVPNIRKRKLSRIVIDELQTQLENWKRISDVVVLFFIVLYVHLSRKCISSNLPRQPQEDYAFLRNQQDYANDGLVDLNANFGKFVDLTKQYTITSQNHMHLVGEYLTAEKEYLMVEKEQALKRARAVAEVMKLTDFSDDDIFDASTMIVDNEAKMEVFLCLPDSRKMGYIRRLLDQQR